MRTATLCNQRNKVMKVELDSVGQIVNILDVYDFEELPLGLKYRLRHLPHYSKWPLSVFADWLNHRRIPKEREGYKEVCTRFPEITRMRNQFSLTDQYWFQWNRSEKWDDLNFFTNRYSSAIGRAFFEPWDVRPEDIPENSPDQTTDGGLRKVWVQDPISLKSSLIKARGRAYMQEPVTEVMASIILEELDIVPFVQYTLVPYGMTFCSKCENFIERDTEFVSASQIYRVAERDKERDTQYQHLLRMCRRIGIHDADRQLDKMLMADMLIGNSDRHLANFGFIRNVETKEIVKFAPLFDLSGAFWGLMSGGAAREQREFARSEDVRIKRMILEQDVLEQCHTLPERAKSLLAQYPEVRDHVKRKVGEQFVRNLKIIREL